jgi:hypothetical protein
MTGTGMKRLLLVAGFLTVSFSADAQTPPPPVTAQPGDAALLQHCDGLLSLAQSYALGRRWIDAWNSTDTSRIMDLYTPDFEFRARGILTNSRISSPTGVLHGQADNRNRWFGTQTTIPSSGFRLIDIYSGVRSIAVHYLNQRSEPVVEVMEYAPDCKIERSNAMYGVLPVGFGQPLAPPPAPKSSGG